MPRPKNPIWFDEKKVREAWIEAKSMSDVIKNLGQPMGSSSFLNIKRAAERYNLILPDGSRDTSAARAATRRPLDEILVERSTYTNRQSLKSRLIQAGMKKDQCEECGIGPQWNNKKLVLQLDHINGVGDDNRIDNLSILCPNCHSQTKTFGYKPNIDRRVAGIPS